MEYVIFLLLYRTLPRTSCYMVNRPRKKICLVGEFAYSETLLAIDFSSILLPDAALRNHIP